MFVDQQGAGATTVAPTGRSEESGLIAILALCGALVFLNRTGIAFLFPAIKPQLHLTNAQIGQLMAATSLAWAVSSVFFTVVSDVLGLRPRGLIVACILGFSAIGALSGAVSTFSALLVLRIAMGLFEGPVIPLIQAMVTEVSPAVRRGRNLGLIIGGSSLAGSVFSPALMTWLADAVGWRASFLAVAIPGPLVALATWFIMAPFARSVAETRYEPVRLRQALQFAVQRNIVVGLVCAVALVGSAVALAAFTPLFVASLPTFTTSGRILFLVGLGVLHSAGGIIIPALSDRFGRKSCLLVASICSTFAPIALMLVQSSSVWVMPAILLAFFASGAFTLAIYVIPGESVPPQMMASTFAILLFFGEILGGATAPTVAGWAADRHGLASALLVTAALAFIGAVASFFVRDPGRLHSRSSGGAASH